MMGTLEECAVCGGEVVEREVEKVLRGGNRAERVKILAKVCLHCGEHFFGPKVIKRFAEVRAKLKISDAPNTPWIGILDKLDYEIWFLDFLEKRRDKEDSVLLEINSSDEQNVRVEMIAEESLDSLYTAPLLNAIMPLTFVAFFKTLDMIFEWIFEENSVKISRQFAAKVERLENDTDLQLPPLFKSQPYLYIYAKALFCQLLRYRNEVVHENRFAVSGDALTLSSSMMGTSLTLSSKQVDYLGRFVRVIVRALTGEIVIDDYRDKMLRYYLDTLAQVHELATFGQQPPLFVHVKLTVPQKGPAFPVDLKNVREQIVRTFPNQETIFDLEVEGVEGKQLIEKWYFAPEDVPAFDVMVLYEESHEANRVELVLP